MTFSHLQLRLCRLVGLSLILQQAAATLDDHDNADARQKPGGLGNDMKRPCIFHYLPPHPHPQTNMWQVTAGSFRALLQLTRLKKNNTAWNNKASWSSKTNSWTYLQTYDITNRWALLKYMIRNLPSKCLRSHKAAVLPLLQLGDMDIPTCIMVKYIGRSLAKHIEQAKKEVFEKAESLLGGSQIIAGLAFLLASIHLILK